MILRSSHATPIERSDPDLLAELRRDDMRELLIDAGGRGIDYLHGMER